MLRRFFVSFALGTAAVLTLESAGSAQCTVFVLTTQAEVDAFSCPVVSGDLTIASNPVNPITNLNALAVLTQVGGHLTIRDNAVLPDLDALGNLTAVGGFLAIDNNDALTDLDGLESLMAVGGVLDVFDNSSLTDFCGVYPLLQLGQTLAFFANNGVNTSVVTILANGPCRETMPIAPYGSVGTYRDIGLLFRAPVMCVIRGLEYPNDDNANVFQALEVIDFGPGGVPTYPSSVVGTQLFYNNTRPPGARVETNVLLSAGRWYGVMGVGIAYPGSSQSHASQTSWPGTFTSSILGQSVVLEQCRAAQPIGIPDENRPYYRSARVYVDIAPLTGLFADFTANVRAGPSPMTVSFSDLSLSNDPGGITSWAWDFDNDGTIDSTLQNPTHVFTGCGDFDVRLVVSDANHVAVSDIETDYIITDVMDTPSFTAELVTPGVYQFTDTTTPTPTAVVWDFDNDGTPDANGSTALWSTPGSVDYLETTVHHHATRHCRTAEKTSTIYLAPDTFLGEVGGGNGLPSVPAAGNYFDIEVTNPSGIEVGALAITPYNYAGPFDCEVYLTSDTHVGKAGNPIMWRLVGAGSDVAVSSGLNPPLVQHLELDAPFYLPSGKYGVAVYLTNPTGAIGMAYSTGPASGPYVGADLTIHAPNSGAVIGCTSTSVLGPCTYSPRLWNGGFHYKVCDSNVATAVSGFYGLGCRGWNGTPEIVATSAPTIGGTFQVDVTNLPQGVAIMVIGLDHQFSAGFGPLPFDATLYGMPGCMLRASDDTTALLPIGNPSTWSLSIPNDPSFHCLRLYLQALVSAPALNAAGWVISDAHALSVGL